MNEYATYKFIEFITFVIHLVIVFFMIQIWFIWIDIGKDISKKQLLINESFAKDNILIVFFISVFFMIHEFVEEINIPNSYLYFEFFELLGFICIVLYIYKWHSALKTCAHKRSPHEILADACMSNNIRARPDGFNIWNRKNKLILTLAVGSFSLIFTSFIPVSTLIFTLMIGLLFIPPLLVFASMLVGASTLSKELSLT